jgi:hypothetical protein
MKMNKTYTLAFLLATTLQVQAQPNEAFRAAMDTCIAETGVTKPERGSRPSQEDRAKIEACLSDKGISKPERPQMDATTKAAMEECAAATGVTRGQRPSEEDRAKLTACLSEKGVTLSHRGGRRARE